MKKDHPAACVLATEWGKLWHKISLSSTTCWDLLLVMNSFWDTENAECCRRCHSAGTWKEKLRGWDGYRQRANLTGFMFTVHQNKAQKWHFNGQESRRDAQWLITVVVLYVRGGKKMRLQANLDLEMIRTLCIPFRSHCQFSLIPLGAGSISDVICSHWSGSILKGFYTVTWKPTDLRRMYPCPSSQHI